MENADITNINLPGFFFIILMGLLLIILPHRFATIPIIISGCYITLGQTLSIVGLNFTPMRILIFFGFLRLLLKENISNIIFNQLDKTILCFVIIKVCVFTILYGTLAAFINHLGFAYNVIGLYFLFRYLILDINDIDRVIKALIVMVIPLAIIMLFEKTTGRNLFAFFGGIPELTIIRDGKLRRQGPFRHPILAGTFAAALVPLFISRLFKSKTGVLLPMIGLIALTIITIVVASSGPILSYFFAIIGMLSWQFRNNMREVRWFILWSFITLSMVMKAPIWFLIARISEFMGMGTGYHRSALIDQAINHFDEWWLFGTTYTAHWMPYTLTDDPKMADMTNQFIYVGVEGGIISVILFIAIIVLSFKTIGSVLHHNFDKPFQFRIMVWSVGASLLSHTVSFISVAYFDQIIIYWYLLLAIIGTLLSMHVSQLTEKSMAVVKNLE